MRFIQGVVLIVVLLILGATVTLLYQRTRLIQPQHDSQNQDMYMLADAFGDREDFQPEMVSDFSLERLSKNSGLTGLNETDRYIEEEVAQQQEITLEQEQLSYYQSFVTPENTVVRLLGRDKTPQQLYDQAVSWIWVPDSVLHGVDEKWMLPERFLVESVDLPGNPVPGSIASDCESQAYTLVSLLRASGVPAEYVRVATGKVQFGDTAQGGHAWVELYDVDEHGWFQLEPTSGSRYDIERNQLVSSAGLPFDYFKQVEYPVIEVWDYFNDIYFYDVARGKGAAPTEWLTDPFLVDKVPDQSTVQYELPADLQEKQQQKIQAYEDNLENEEQKILTEAKRSLIERNPQTLRKIRENVITRSPTRRAQITASPVPSISKEVLSKRSIQIVMLFLIESFDQKDATSSAEQTQALTEVRSVITQSPDLTAAEKEQLEELLTAIERRVETGLTADEVRKAEQVVEQILEE